MIQLKLVKSSQIGGCALLLMLSGAAFAGSICEGDVKVEGGGTVTYIAPVGGSVSEVCLKPGNQVLTFSCIAGQGEVDPSGCYLISWGPDCVSVTVSQLVSSRECKQISHTAASFGDEPPSCEPSKEVCDGVDNDCDGEIDEGLSCKP